ncbi:hypothetical protein VOLCADRAFT_88333 [Volvox carteri f. nagariensis]|uniref:Uncharacterized protein n=1 Tax=Volvox carteri f. nagariensis TaxID=3068 RepID=D8TNX3_VOLCA|nr:uncharacterized protein VOLCADRAFT_88333 [Volvox carteri f. nagariensis]EFJ51066.1 hypothetical protein VOLCADRAFT_88333 [Volvox carteri f. nagariensis]|eukprot:XP_002948078.1 hypothetical protein VOLCADRAFT_88333 [Volvox carteri f. nagariensis]
MDPTSSSTASLPPSSTASLPPSPPRPRGPTGPSATGMITVYRCADGDTPDVETDTQSVPPNGGARICCLFVVAVVMVLAVVLPLQGRCEAVVPPSLLPPPHPRYTNNQCRVYGKYMYS